MLSCIGFGYQYRYRSISSPNFDVGMHLKVQVCTSTLDLIFISMISRFFDEDGRGSHTKRDMNLKMKTF